jgi:hypothetical protein
VTVTTNVVITCAIGDKQFSLSIGTVGWCSVNCVSQFLPYCALTKFHLLALCLKGLSIIVSYEILDWRRLLSRSFN